MSYFARDIVVTWDAINEVIPVPFYYRFVVEAYVGGAKSIVWVSPLEYDLVDDGTGEWYETDDFEADAGTSITVWVLTYESRTEFLAPPHEDCSVYNNGNYPPNSTISFDDMGAEDDEIAFHLDLGVSALA